MKDEDWNQVKDAVGNQELNKDEIRVEDFQKLNLF